MMKRWCLVLMVSVLLIFPAAGIAAVQQSLHDVDNYKNAEQNVGGACAHCHIPHGASGEKLYKDNTAIVPSSNWLTANQPVSRICRTCHNASSTIINTNARTVAMYNQDNAHKSIVAQLYIWGDHKDLPGTGVKLSTDDLRLECTSCHDPHETVSRPFLKYTDTAGDIHGNCVKCHVNRNNESKGGSGGANANIIAWDNGTTGNASQHPTAKNMSADAGYFDEEDWVATIDSAFDNPAITTASPTAKPGVDANTWWSRGKYNSDDTVMEVGCQTCHAVHGVEADSAVGAVSFNNDGLKGAGAQLLAKSRTPGSGEGSVFCEGCHTEDVIDPAIAGSRHPVNDDNTAWGVEVQVGSTTWAKNWWWGDDANDRLTCETCHDVHYGSDNTAILRRKAGNIANHNGGIDNQAATAFGSLGEFCNECHSVSPASTVTFASGQHHPVSYYKDNTTELALIFSGDGQNIRSLDGGTALRHATAANTNWATRARTVGGGEPAYKFGNIGSDNVMVCGTCHGNVAGSAAGAHPLAFGLDTNTESEMCVDCHTFNPSAFVKAYEKDSPGIDNDATMTHFVGTIVTDAYKRSTSSNWTDGPAGVGPKYAQDDGGKEEIICESCHYWKSGNLTSVNEGAVGESTQVTQAVVNGLLGHAGNNWEGTSDNAANLCSGCHGGAPGGGSSHPVRPNDYTSVTALANNVADNVTNQTNRALGNATLNDTNKVNCDSCHRAHNASVGTGALILEANTTDPVSNKGEFRLHTDNNSDTEWLNQEGLCSRCHGQGK